MSRAADLQGSDQDPVASPCLPAGRVLDSGAIVCPGGFDQHGCPLIVFPADGHAKLSSQLGKADAVDFIRYCLHLNKKQEVGTLVSVVADLRNASPQTTTFIAETLHLLQLQKKTVHTAYIIQPKKKECLKLLLKLLASESFSRVVVKDVSELSVFIDRSQLTASLGGYLVYCHQSWAAFITEIDAFVQEFLSVVQRLPSCIATLQALSRLPLPTTTGELHHFCSTNEAKVQQLRRELGLDELLRRCEAVVEKLRCPEKEPCYQAMAGTALFTQTAFDMLQNHSRISAAVEKVDCLLQQVISKARLQLQVFQLREDALQIMAQTEKLLEKLKLYEVEIAKDAPKADMLLLDFEAPFNTPAMALIRCAEDVIHTLEEILPFDSQTSERWVLDLEKLRDQLYSTVQLNLQTLQAVCSYHRYYNKARSWYSLILCENFLQQLLLDVDGNVVQTQQQRHWGAVPVWRQKLATFLTKNPPPELEELVHLTHLSNIIPDRQVQQAGKRMSERCMTLRKVLSSVGPVTISALQLALQWQYEFLQSDRLNVSSDSGSSTGVLDSPGDAYPLSAKTGSRLEVHTRAGACHGSEPYLPRGVGKEMAGLVGTTPSAGFPGMALTRGKQSSLSSFDSGVDGVGGSHLELGEGGERLERLSRLSGTRNTMRPPQIHKENLPSVCPSEDCRGTLGPDSRPSIQVMPKVTTESFNFEIKVTRSAELPNNPWLSLPVDDLENSYTITITPNPPQCRDPSGSCCSSHQSNQCQDQPSQTEVLNGTQSRGPRTRDWILQSQSSFEDPELSPGCDILSSTITEGRDKFSGTAEGFPTLLWDSYDLHEQSPDAADGAIFQKDWDVKEQQSLREVEKILEKTDEILEEEENVLAQEAMLDVLLRSECRQNQWALWDREDQPGQELVEAGVLGHLVPADSDLLCGRGAAGSEGGDSECRATGAAEVATVASDSRPELRDVHVLDKPITEDNVKINESRRSEENPDAEFLNPNNEQSVKKSRPVSKLQREEEVDRLDEVKKPEEDLKCSLMEKSGDERQDVCELLSDGYNKSSSSVLDPFGTENPISVPTQKDQSQRLHSRFEEAGMKDGTGSSAEPSVFNRSLRNSSKAPEELRIQTPGFLSGKELDGENPWTCKPEASGISEMRPDNGAFDPGGKGDRPPEPGPRGFGSESLKHETPPRSTDLMTDASSAADPDPGFKHDTREDSPGSRNLNFTCHPDLQEHNNNNNNNNHPVPWNHQEPGDHGTPPGTSAGCGGGPTVSPEVKTSVPPDESSPNVASDLPLKFDPGGQELDQDVPARFQRSDATRTSARGSPGVQIQLAVNTLEVTDFKTPVILDMGSGLMKAGFADQDRPAAVLPMMIGMPKYEELMNGNLDRETYIGHDAQHMRGVLVLKHPVKNGVIHSWDDMEKIWHHTFQQLRVNPEDHPVLLTEAAMNPLEKRERMVEVMFECFGVPFACVAMQAVLALYSAGRSTGVVFDSGDGVSHSVPVFEGYALPHAIQRFPLAGADVTMQLKKAALWDVLRICRIPNKLLDRKEHTGTMRLLQEAGVTLSTSAELEIVREMKEQCCCVALDYQAELAHGLPACGEAHYTMPDGQVVTLGSERFRAPEVLFKPELIGREHSGIHQSVFKSIISSDIDLRRHFLGNIILSGGNTLLPGLPERLQAEIQDLLPGNMRGCVRITSPKDRAFSVWRGGAVLAALPTFSSAWISRDEYEDYGPQIVFRKCF